MHEGFDVPGYILDRLLGFGGTGEVWAARPAAGGDPVAVKRLRTQGADGVDTEEARRRLRREARLLAEIDDPHVIRLHRVVRSSSGDDVLILDLAEGGSLARVLSIRGRLTAGEVVTIAVPLAQSLASAHRRGILHGDVSTANVLFAADGRPMLADLGVARLIGESAHAVDGTSGFTDPGVLTGAPPGPEGDVYGLAAVCWAALTGRTPDSTVSAMSAPARAEALCASAPGTPRELADAVACGLSADPPTRPDAAGFARLVWGSSAPQPVRLPAGPPRPATADGDDDRPTRRVRLAPVDTPVEPVRRKRGAGRPWRPLRAAWPTLNRRAAARGMAAIAIPMVLACAVWAGTRWADRTGRDTAPTPQPAVVADWSAVLASLDERWSTAFSTGDLEGLHAVDAHGSPALAGDSALLQRYIDTGVSARGVRFERLSVAARTVARDRVVLDVVDRIGPYDIVDAGGAVVRTDPGRVETAWRITMVPTDLGVDGWRISSVARA